MLTQRDDKQADDGGEAPCFMCLLDKDGAISTRRGRTIIAPSEEIERRSDIDDVSKQAEASRKES